MRFNKSVTAVALALAITVFGGHSAYATDTKQTLDSGSDNQVQTSTNTNTPIEVTVGEGDTLTAIATAHRTTVETIVTENKIADANLVEPGQVIKVTPGEEQLADKYSKLQVAAVAFITPPAPQPVARPVSRTASTYTTRSYSSAPTSADSYYVGNGMWCTDYVHSKRPDVPVYGNAGYGWVSAAQAQGKATGSTPQAGAVAVMNGHVAYVESVNADGSYIVSEMGWNYKAGNYNQRTVQPGAFGQFIY